MYKLDKNTNKQYLLFLILYLLYLCDNRIGLILSIYGIITAWTLKYIDNYENETIIKAYLILSLALVIYLTTTNTISEDIFNKFASPLLMINIVVLIVTYKTINKNKMYIIIAILFIVMTTPKFKYVNNQIIMKSNIISKDLWIILQTIVLLAFYLTNHYFYMNPNIYLVLFSLLAPLITHYMNNKWLEARLFFLTILIIHDQFYH
uniref:Uncharacterized protein n=1 Tax=viral metagenome TaxID=1070528 RepID=A0A6C0CYA6_9ZZZZ